jgi:tRNA(Ile)-lysidine synthase TilS/MesJ
MTKTHEITKSTDVIVAISGCKDSIATLLTVHRLGYKSLIPVHFADG